MKALVSGATGFVGQRLLEQLDGGVVLSRDADQARQALSPYAVEAHSWDPRGGPPPAAAFEGVEVVFHLAGESVGEGRWNTAKKERIRASREQGTRHLVEAIAALPEGSRPQVLVSASAVGYYGDRGDERLDESARPADDFLAQVCQAWEAQSQKASELGVRVVNPRIGVVLGKGGGALQKMLTPFRLCVGGRLGSGNQYMAWIHLDDLVELLLHAARREEIQGPMNAVAPGVVTNRQFTATLARVLGRPAIFPAPAFALKAVLGEFAEVLLASQRVEPKVAQETGYAFQFAELEPALRAILG